jgi:hypothetical protein
LEDLPATDVIAGWRFVSGGTSKRNMNLEKPWTKAENFETVEISLRSEDNGESLGGPHIIDLSKNQNTVDYMYTSDKTSEPATRKTAGATR